MTLEVFVKVITNTSGLCFTSLAGTFMKPLQIRPSLTKEKLLIYRSRIFYVPNALPIAHINIALRVVIKQTRKKSIVPSRTMHTGRIL